METPLARRDSWPCAASPNTALLGMGIGVAAVWMMSGGVRLFFSSGWSLRAITGRHKGCLGPPLILGHAHSLLSGRRRSCMEGGFSSEHWEDGDQKAIWRAKSFPPTWQGNSRV